MTTITYCVQLCDGEKVIENHITKSPVLAIKAWNDFTRKLNKGKDRHINCIRSVSDTFVSRADIHNDIK